MTTAEVNARPTEQELVEQWRAERLELAGYPPADAATIAARPDVDLHHGGRAARQGLPGRSRAPDPAVGSA